MKKYEFIDKVVYLEKEDILILTDLHIGFEEGLRKQGVFVPKQQFEKTLSDLKKIFSRLKQERKKVEEIVILGDLKHEFGNASFQEWSELGKLIDFFEKKNVKKIILIKGNHDTFFNKKIQERLGIKKYYIKKNLAFLHGDKKFIEVLDKKIKYLFLGHLHPAISIRKQVKQETYKCFLTGKWKNKETIILPSFFPLIEGSDVSIYNTNLDFDFDLGNFEVFIPVENSDKGEVLSFGKVKGVGRLV